MSITDIDKKPNFGINEGVWEYLDDEGKIIGYTERKKRGNNKYFLPWSFQNNEWVPKWYEDALFKPIYRGHLLKQHPDKSVLIVEGEKTADAAAHLFSDFVCVTWMGGCGSAGKINPLLFKNRKVCIWPDNDVAGFKAAKKLKEKLKGVAAYVGTVNPSLLGVEPKWDLADFDEEHGTIDFEILKLALEDAGKEAQEFCVDTYPDLTGSAQRPRPLDTTNNLKHLLDHYSIKMRWNMMKRIRETIIPEVDLYQEEAENQALTYITNLSVTHEFPIRRVDKHLDQISWDNKYHPIRDWLLSKPLKDSNIFTTWLNTIQTTNNELSYMLIKRWMISAIAAAFNDGGFCAQGVLVIQGEPGTHKSSFIASLAPESLNAIKGGLSLDPTKKDDIFTSAEYWIAELGELDATFRKADIARLKAYITNDVDDVRRPHAIRNSKMIRRTVFAATVNETNFLIDTTGNRRWWTISVTDKIKTRHELDMQQVWRTVYEMYLQGESPILLENELALLNQENKQYEFIDPFEEKLDAHFYWDSPPLNWMTSSQILDVIGYKNPTKSQATKMSSILKKRGLTKGSGSTKMKRCYLMPNYRFICESMN